MAQKSSGKFDAAGWLFWVVLFFVFIGPSIWLAFRISFAHSSKFIMVGTGVVIAALAAGIVSWAINGVIQFRKKRERLSERKKSRKKR